MPLRRRLILDFPGLSQTIRLQSDAAFDRFGRDFWMLPNPMYGSWTRNADPQL